ncbi:hypothetical protein GJ496_010715 [Pomphorhynchus laevis]|nr:hypothetical protein GJ496_010715 [Pomphorhynchus laevis]
MPTNMRGLALSQLKDLNLTNEWARDYEPSGEYNYNADPFLERNGEVDSTLVKLKIVKHPYYEVNMPSKTYQLFIAVLVSEEVARLLL